MDKQELFNQVKSAVDVIFAEKEDADKQAKAAEALRKSATTINDLTTELEKIKQEFSELEAKNTELTTSLEEKEEACTSLEDEVTSLKEDVNKKEEENASLKSEVDELKKSKEDIESEFSGIKEELETIKKDKLTEDRMKELEEAKVVAKDKEKQVAKVRDLSEEEFASYKEDLVSIRESIVESISTSNTSGEGVEPDEGGVTHANVDKSKGGGMNLETASKDMYTQYSELGKALASRMNKKEEDK